MAQKLSASLIGIFLILSFGIAGCSLKSKNHSSNIKIILEGLENARQSLSSLALSNGLLAKSSTLPTSIADFDCFTLNVTGPSIQPNQNVFGHCVSTDNMRGRGFGRASNFARRGGSLEVDVTVGSCAKY